MLNISRRCLYILSTLWCSSTFAVQLTSEVDTQSLSLGENLTYTVKADANLSDDAIDIKPLFKNFIIGNLQISHASENETTWIIPLQPVTAGEITLPSLQVANSESKPITINVSDKTTSKIQTDESSSQIISEQNTSDRATVQLDGQISAESAYKNEILTYTVTVVKRADPENRPPVVAAYKGMTIQSAGAPTEDKQIFSDHYQETLTYTYFILPEMIGSLSIPSMSLASNSKKSTPAQTITVKPLPHSFKGNERDWLPSAGISIEERWEPATSYAKAGQPLTRIITLTGINNIPVQLPTISAPVITDLKIYKDSETEEQQYQNGMVISKKIIKHVYVPEKNIPFVTPKIDIHWWNTISDRPQDAVIEERKFMASVTNNLVSKQLPKSIQIKNESWLNAFLPFLKKIIYITILMVGLLIPILFILWHYRSFLQSYYKSYQLWKFFKQSCSLNDPMQAYKALLVWASQRWNHSFTGLESLPFYTSLQPELDELQSACFHETEQKWNGKSLLSKLDHRKIRKQHYIHKK